MKNNIRDLLEAVRGVEELRQRGIEHEVEINTPSNEIKEIQLNANKVLHVFLESNKSYILSKLADIEGIDKLAVRGKSLYSMLEENMEYSLDKLILQELLVLKKTTLESRIGHPISDETVRKMIKGLLFKYFLGLKEIQRNNLNSTQSNFFLKNLYKLNPDSVSKMLTKFENLPDKPLARHEIILYATITQDADSILSKAVEEFYILEKEFKDNPYVNKSLIQRCIFSKNPRNKLKAALEAIDQLANENPELDISSIKLMVTRYKGDYKNIHLEFKNKLNYIYSLNIDINEKIAKRFALKASNLEELQRIIEEYLDVYKSLSEKYPEFKFFIRARGTQDKESLEKNIQKIIKSVNEVLLDPRLPKELRRERNLVLRACIAYGSQDLFENLSKILKFYNQIKKELYEESELFADISDNFKTEIVNIYFISPIKTLEENREFIYEKFKLFKILLSELESKYGSYKKRNQKDNQGYIKFLIDSIYHKEPKKHLEKKGFII